MDRFRDSHDSARSAGLRRSLAQRQWAMCARLFPQHWSTAREARPHGGCSGHERLPWFVLVCPRRSRPAGAREDPRMWAADRARAGNSHWGRTALRRLAQTALNFGGLTRKLPVIPRDSWVMPGLGGGKRRDLKVPVFPSSRIWRVEDSELRPRQVHSTALLLHSFVSY